MSVRKRMWGGILALGSACLLSSAAADAQSYPPFAQVWDVEISGASTTHGFGVADENFRGPVRVLAGPNGGFGVYTQDGIHMRWAVGAWKAEAVENFSVVVTSVVGSRGRETAVWHLGGDENERHLFQPLGERRAAFRLPEEPVGMPRDFNVHATPRAPQATIALSMGTWAYARGLEESRTEWVLQPGGEWAMTSVGFEGRAAEYGDGLWEARGAQENTLGIELAIYSRYGTETERLLVRFLSEDYMEVTINASPMFMVRAPARWSTEVPAEIGAQMAADPRWQVEGCGENAVQESSVRGFDLNSDGRMDFRTRTPCRKTDGVDILNVWLQEEDGGFREVLEFHGQMVVAIASEDAHYSLLGTGCAPGGRCIHPRFAWDGERYSEVRE